MSRKLVVAAVTAACLIGFGACGTAYAESSLKSSKPKTSEKLKGGGQGASTKPTTDRNSGPSTGDRTDSDYGMSGPKGR